jgi:hypothetical protein
LRPRSGRLLDGRERGRARWYSGSWGKTKRVFSFRNGQGATDAHHHACQVGPVRQLLQLLTWVYSSPLNNSVDSRWWSRSTSLEISVAVGSPIVWVSFPQADFAWSGSCSFLSPKSLSSESATPNNILRASASHLQILSLSFQLASAVSRSRFPSSRSTSALRRRRPGLLCPAHPPAMSLLRHIRTSLTPIASTMELSFPPSSLFLGLLKP